MPTVNLADPAIALPEILVVDASLFLVLRPGATHPHRSAAAAFLNRVAAKCSSGNMMCLAPTIVLEECYYKIIQFHIQGVTNTYWHQYYKANPQIVQQCIPHIVKFHQIIMALPAQIVTPEDLALTQPASTLEERMRHFVSAYDLLPKDAYILAVAERLGVRNVATLDADWHRARQFTVYTC